MGELMHYTTVNQIIQTSGLILVALIGLSVYWTISKTRGAIQKETVLLKDCYFYRQVIEKYKVLLKEHGESSMINTLRREVEEEVGYSSSRLSQPSAISKRSLELCGADKELEQFISKIKIR